MKIGILNTGNIGGRLARAWASAGHEIVVAKDGDDRKLEPLLKELGGNVRLGTIREAAEFGEVILFSVYWPRAEAVVYLAGDAFDGKVVIETMNPLAVTEKFEHYHDLEFMRDNSTAEVLQKLIPNARVVKAFNLLASPLLEAAAWAKSSTQPGIFYATDDHAAGQVTRKLITDSGFKPLNAGPLKSARTIEQAGILIHEVATLEYGGGDYLNRLAITIVEANPGPVYRDRVV
ncbi:NADPH-dependent F420 reductase [Rhizosphaericola mali]|uniref:NADPH-dependent F420 reductase n=1 Tax=Rhizosphaericola mali TaxID=2545455 RepID=A0A5P2FWF2_9BACT|nr:NADPH-dependent F420 reductase [Rhizosphaericola mali]QES87856.1 NADPH-dependent F420 reductase [Rhizosphaericola mali]